jgi:hypothetical protein
VNKWRDHFFAGMAGFSENALAGFDCVPLRNRYTCGFFTALGRVRPELRSVCAFAALTLWRCGKRSFGGSGWFHEGSFQR